MQDKIEQNLLFYQRSKVGLSVFLLILSANPYMTPYPRRIWPLYSSIPFMMPYHYAHYSKRKGGQVRFTANQTDALEKRFNSNKYLSPEDRRLLADSLKLTDRQVHYL